MRGKIGDGMSGGKVHGPCKFSGCVSVCVLCVLLLMLVAMAGGGGPPTATIPTNNDSLPVCSESVIVGVVYGGEWWSGSLPAIFLAQ